jgi:hypothetical protein
VVVDVNEFISRAKKKIRLLSASLIPKIGFNECLCEAKDIYILSQAIEVVQDSITSQECIDKTISELVNRYCLEDLLLIDGSGIGIFRVDNNEDCSVFKIYL